MVFPEPKVLQIIMIDRFIRVQIEEQNLQDHIHMELIPVMEVLLTKDHHKQKITGRINLQLQEEVILLDLLLPEVRTPLPEVQEQPVVLQEAAGLLVVEEEEDKYE